MQPITCQVCHTENDPHGTICTSCGGYLQNKLPNLDLFHMVWKMIENPFEAFRMIVMAEHKNYSVFLFSLVGIAFVFDGFWFFRVGERFSNILPLIASGVLIGLVIGSLLAPMIAVIHWFALKIFSKKAAYRISLGVTSYSTIPIILSFAIVLPIELMTFGMYLFTFNPHPMTIKPFEYIVLISLNGILLLWSAVLSLIGTRISGQISWWKAVITTMVFWGITGIALFIFSSWAVKYI